MMAIEAVEKTLAFLKTLGMSQEETTVVAEFVAQTMRYNTIKMALTEEIKQELLDEIKKLVPKEKGVRECRPNLKRKK